MELTVYIFDELVFFSPYILIVFCKSLAVETKLVYFSPRPKRILMHAKVFFVRDSKYTTLFPSVKSKM